MTEARARTVMRAAQAISGLLLTLGILGLLRTMPDHSGDESVTLFIIVVAPASSAVYLLLGLVGTAMATRAARARRFMVGLAGLMILWAVVGAILRGSPSDAVSGDPAVLLMHLGLAAVAGVAVGWPEHVPEARLAAPDLPAPVADIPAPHLRSRMEQGEAASEEASTTGVVPEGEPPPQRGY